MKKIYLVSCLLTLTLFSGFHANANQVSGADIEYRFTGQDTLKLILKVYRDCSSGTNLGSSYTCQLKKTGCSGQDTVSVTLNRVLVQAVHNTCSSVGSYCESGSYPNGIELNRYESTVYLQSLFPGGLASSCCSLLFTFSECCRSSNITNLVSSSSTFFIQAEINRCISPYNSSPQFTIPPMALIPNGMMVWYNNGVIDTIDSDSISYELAYPLTSSGTWDTYKTALQGYPFYFLGHPNANLPVPAGLHLDQLTGDFGFTALSTTPQIVALAFKITEWRKVNGSYQKIGSIRRENTFYTYTGTGNNPPELEVNGSRSGPWNFSVCSGTKLCLDIKATDKDTTSSKSDTTQITFGKNIGGASYTSGNANSNITRHDIASFCWTPDHKYVSSLPYSFVVRASDNNCPVPAITSKVIRILVKQGIGEHKLVFTKLGLLKFAMKAKPTGNAAPAKYFTWYVTKIPSPTFSFGNVKGYNNAGDSIVHTFDSAGTYIIAMKADAGDQCEKYFYDTIRIDCNLSVKISPSATQMLCKGTAVSFTLSDSGSLGNVSHKWYARSMGLAKDSLIDSLHGNVTYTAPLAGYYLIRGIAKDSLCPRMSYAMIYVADKPVAAFSASPLIGNIPLTVNFTNQSTGRITKYNWSFGDTSASPSPVFTQTGFYNVWMKVTNQDSAISCSDSIYKPDHIRVKPACTIQPTLSKHDVWQCSGSGDVALNSSLTGSQGNAQYRWTATNLQNQQSILLDSLNTSVQFPKTLTGHWRVVLETTDSVCNRTDTARIHNLADPSASFIGSPLSGNTPLNVQFTYNGSEATTYQWSFGSAADSPAYVFNSPGYQQVWLKVSRHDTMGLVCKDSIYKMNYIRVFPVCNMSLSLNQHHVVKCSDASPVTFQSTVGGSQGSISYRWTSLNLQTQQSAVLDSLNSSISFPSGTAGSWRMILKSSDSVCSKWDTAYIHIATTPVANFSANTTSGNAPLSVQFTNTSSGSPTAYLWSFGDTTANASFTYTQAGTYSVWMKAWRKDTLTLTCKDSIYKSNYISVGPNGIAELASGDIRVYPNPAHDEIHIVFPKQASYEIALFSYTGQRLQGQKVSDSERTIMQRNGLPTGIYLLKVTAEGGEVWVRRIRVD